MKSRVLILFGGFIFAWAILAGRAAYLQLWPHNRLRPLSESQFEKQIKVQSHRGAIYDSRGEALAASVASFSLFADPSLIENPKDVSRRLAKITGESRSKIYKKIKNKKRRFIWIERQLTKAQKEEVDQLDVRGLGFIREPKRIYPHGSLLSQVIGFVGREDKGLEGLEYSMNDKLASREKKMTVQKDARGRPLLLDVDIFAEGSEGNDVHLTIDSELQFFLERELEQAVNRHQADHAMGVILNVEDSKVLAMATSPGYDLNRSTSYVAAHRRNRPVTDVFEPGSTMKTFVIAAAMEEGLIRPNTKINCEGGRFEVGDRIIREADTRHSYDELSVSEVLAKSSNIGTTKIAFMLGDKKVDQFLRKLKFGNKTDLKLPGESGGIYNPPPWRQHLLSNISFGHGIGTTAVQVANAYAAIARGGIYKEPHLVQKVVNPKGRVLWEAPDKQGEQVLKPQVANWTKMMLTLATAPGSTGVTARIPGFPVAGKTGTAQKVDPKNGGYMRGAYLSSFAGFVPAHDPKYVIYIVVDHPKDKHNYYGSQVAAPIFSRVAGYAVRRAGLTPILISKTNVLSNQEDGMVKQQKRAIEMLKASTKVHAASQVPDLEGLTLRQALARVRELGLKARVFGSGRVERMNPSPGSDVPGDRRVDVYLR